MHELIAYTDKNRDRYLEELRRFLAIPSVSRLSSVTAMVTSISSSSTTRRGR